METSRRKALGRGLEELFNNEPMDYEKIEEKIIEESNNEEIVELPLSELRSNPYQPRKNFDENALRIGSLNITEGVRDTSVYHTRIFSTNDASIVLDELSLPYDVSINDTWAGKEENSTETDNSIQAQPTNLSENQTNS